MAFRLVLITPPEPATPRELDVAQQLLGSGKLQTLHLRKPGSSREQVAQYLAALSRDARSKVVLHSHHDLSKSTSIGGVHFREADRPPGVIKAPAGLSVSTSFHVLPDLSVCRGDLDYCFLSPIYSSISKPGYEAAFQHSELEAALAGARHPVLALGGVTADKFGELAGLGFAGAALLGAVWGAGDTLAAWQEAAERAEGLG
ncbi:Thiamine-phosphate synthase [Chlorella vulgaris]